MSFITCQLVVLRYLLGLDANGVLRLVTADGEQTPFGCVAASATVSL